MSENSVNLPEECWELIFTFLVKHRHSHHLESLSLVSKQFLSITNRLRISLTISDLTLPLLPRIFSRFPLLKSLDLRLFNSNLRSLLVHIAESGLDLHSLNISNHKNIPFQPFSLFASRMPNLISLHCSNIGFLSDHFLFMIPRSFPNLQLLDISYPTDLFAPSSFFPAGVTDSRLLPLIQALPRLRSLNLSGNSFLTNNSLLALSTNCLLLEEIAVCDCDFITQSGIAMALRHSPNLISISANCIGTDHVPLITSLLSLKSLTSLHLSDSVISDEFLHSLAKASFPLRKLILSHCQGLSFSGISLLFNSNQLIEWLDLEATNFLTDKFVEELSHFLRCLKFINLGSCSSLTCFSLFILARNCPILNHIKMENVNLEKGKDYNVLDFLNPQIMSLDLSGNADLCNESVGKFASICPNLEQLKLNHCARITEQGIRQVLRVCTKIRHLEVNFCSGIKNLVMDFELSMMEALKLQGLAIEDEALKMVGKRCPSLIHLDLLGCLKVSAEGVREVVRNCRRLREIDLRGCDGVDDSVIPWMVFSRPSLRGIMPTSSFFPTNGQRELFLQHGCVVLTHGYRLDLKGIS